MVCDGANDELPKIVAYPFLLLKNHHFTKLKIADDYNGLKRVGVAHTLAAIRDDY